MKVLDGNALFRDDVIEGEWLIAIEHGEHLWRHLGKVAFNLVNPIAIHSNLLGYGAELRHTLGCTLDNLIRTSDAELAPEFNQVFVSDVNGLSSESQIVGWIELVSRIETRECQVVCRCDVPTSYKLSSVRSLPETTVSSLLSRISCALRYSWSSSRLISPEPIF